MSLLDSLKARSKDAKGTPKLLPKTSPADEARISQTLGLRSLESMPTQAAQAFQLACNPRSTLADFTKVVESDEVLSARIIRIANSVYYRRGEEAKEISKAVASIGLDEIRCLLSAAMLKSLLKSNSKDRNYIWGNSVATGIAARKLSSLTSVPEGEAFLCGILHDVGKLILIQRIPKEYSTLVRTAFDSETTFAELEENAFDVNHIEIGKWLAEKWNFPESVRTAITFHHSPWSEHDTMKGKLATPAALVKCADTIAHAGFMGHPHSRTVLGKHARSQLIHVATQLDTSLENIQGLLQQISLQFDDDFSLFSSP